jgi:hypothetical protein
LLESADSRDSGGPPLVAISLHRSTFNLRTVELEISQAPTKSLITLLPSVIAHGKPHGIIDVVER